MKYYPVYCVGDSSSTDIGSISEECSFQANELFMVLTSETSNKNPLPLHSTVSDGDCHLCSWWSLHRHPVCITAGHVPQLEPRRAHSMAMAEMFLAFYFSVSRSYFCQTNWNFCFLTETDIRDYVYLIWVSMIFFLSEMWSEIFIVGRHLCCPAPSFFPPVSGMSTLLLKLSWFIFSFYKIWVRFFF